VEGVLTACHDNILAEMSNGQCRLAFLDYHAETEGFTLLAGRNMPHESEMDVQKLTRENSLAGRVIMTQTRQYVPDVDDRRAASEAGYLPIGHEPAHKSIVCVGVWVDRRPVGVLIADSTTVDAFSDADFDTLEYFAEKIEVIECGFGAQQENTVRREYTGRNSAEDAIDRWRRRVGQ
jgi:putative methionine-R-sulfoxide reductase with GAF domain